MYWIYLSTFQCCCCCCFWCWWCSFCCCHSCCNCCRAASWCEAGAIFSHEQKQMCAIYIYQSLRISRTSPFSPIHRIVWKQETSPKPTKPSSQSTTFRWIFLRYFIQNHKSIDPLDDPPSTRPTPWPLRLEPPQEHVTDVQIWEILPHSHPRGSSHLSDFEGIANHP